MNDLRALFAIPDDIAYFNCAAMTPLLTPVRDAGSARLAERAAPWTIRHPEAYYEQADLARSLFSRLINADPSDIAITPATSYGIAVAALNLPLRPGHRVVIPAGQHYSNVFQWLASARRSEAEAVLVPRPCEGAWTVPVLDAIDERTDIVAVPPCDWIDGRLFDLEAIAAKARAVGAALVIDATQALGVLPLDVAALRPDFVACSTFKWLLGPSNLSLLYAAPWRQSGAPIEHHALSRIGFLGDGRAAGGATVSEDFIPGAARYDMGQRNNLLLLAMLNAGLSHLSAWDIASVAARIGKLNGEIAARLRGLGLPVITDADRAPHILAADVPAGIPAPGLGGRFASRKVYLTVRDGRIRISTHLHNTDDDIGRLLTAVEDILVKAKET